MLRRCLQKDRRQRLDSAAAVRLEIVDAMTSPDAGTAAARRIPSLSFSAAAVAAAALLFVAGVWIGTRSATTPQAPIRLGIVLPPSQRQPIPEDTREIAISPDGRLIALRLDAVSGGRLALRALHELDAKVLPGIGNARSPFFSADGQWVGFFDGTTLQKVSVAGGPPIVIARDVVGEAASWGDDDTIVFAAGGGLWRVDPNGGTPIPVLAASHSEGDYTLPAVLPGSRAVLFTVRQRSPFVAGTSRRSVADADNVQIAVLDLATGTHKVLLRGATCAEYASSGHVLYAMAGTLFAVRFDLTRLEVQGVPVPVVEDVQMALNAGAASYTLSRSGSLAYVPGSARTRVLVWVDRHGVETPINAPPRAYHYLKLSPDGSRVALEVREEQDLYIWHFADATFTRLTFDPALDVIPAWTRDGKNVVFGSARDGRINLYMQAADGSGETRRLTKSDTAQFVNSVAPDGEHLLGVQWSERTLYDIFRFTLGGRAPPEVLVQTPAVDYAAMVSPNGRYFAYQSYESGRSEIYVRPFPVAASGRWQVSTGGGTAPVWAPDGRELFYLDHTRTLMALPVDTSSTFRSGTPRKVLDAGYAVPANFGVYDVSPTGEQFLMLKETGAANPDATPTSVVVVINWLSELASKLPTDRR
jgi:serine/threonine-protein kinase